MNAPLRDVVVHGSASREAWAAARRDPTALRAALATSPAEQP